MRYHILDNIRGINLISMIIYHLIWDAVYILDNNWTWHESIFVYIWQQSICWTFILLSGFCWSMGKNKLKRGLQVFGMGMAISLITTIFMPEQKIIFGVLTMIGSCMLLMIILDKILKNVSPVIGIFSCSLLFGVFRNINNGYLGFESWNIMKIPSSLYSSRFMTYLGFKEPNFYSTDYFSLFPRIFLFILGYFLYKIIKNRDHKYKILYKKGIGWIEFAGKNSLRIYLLHQPVIYLGLLAYSYF